MTGALFLANPTALWLLLLLLPMLFWIARSHAAASAARRRLAGGLQVLTCVALVLAL